MTKRALDLRIWPRVKMTDTCWVWMGSTSGGNSRSGEYGALTFRDPPQTRYVHRLVYEQLVGPIPEGMQIDHLCRNKLCCRPEHLEPVTHYENSIARGTGPFATRARQTHCLRGHEYTEENTCLWNGRRECRTCRNMRKRKSWKNT